VPERILIIDDDQPFDDTLSTALKTGGLLVDLVNDGFSAIEKLRSAKYVAVILDPMIRHRLNGYAVLNFVEMEKPEILDRLFLLTGMSEQTIARTAPIVLPRLFRKPKDVPKVVAAIVALIDHKQLPGDRTVLLVEDDPDTARLTSELVQDLGYQVTLAATGREALQHLAIGEYAAIVLDLVLPDLDGFEILEHLRQKNSPALRHVIVITGMPDRYIDRLDRDQICAVLQKPITPAELSQMLQRCEEPAD
jgi:CheY-like chemotaxis protein